MEKQGLIEILNSIRTDENSEAIDKALEIVGNSDEEKVQSICEGKSEEEIVQMVLNRIARYFK